MKGIDPFCSFHIHLDISVTAAPSVSRNSRGEFFPLDSVTGYFIGSMGHIVAEARGFRNVKDGPGWRKRPARTFENHRPGSCFPVAS